MKQLIVCSASDLHHLEKIVKKITVDTTVLVSAGNFDKAILGKLKTDNVKLNLTYNCDSSSSRLVLFQEMKGLERAYFVVSNPVMSSSAYQALSYSLFPWLLQVDCWKIMLDDAKIPLGFAFLRHLPDGVPFEQSFGLARIKQRSLKLLSNE